MNSIYLELVMGFVIGFTYAIVIHVQYKKEMKGERKEDGPQYAPFISPYMFPVYILLLAVLWPMMQRVYGSMVDLIMRLFSIFLHISIYYVALLLVMPLLRGRISARVCAVLWILPTLLYVLGRFKTSGILRRPWLVIHLPGIPAVWWCLIWATGFGAVMLWKCVSHLRFRKRILENAELVTDPMILQRWKEEQEEAQLFPGTKVPLYYFPLVQSEEVTTPLAIGMFKSTTHMVLPKKEYTQEELTLIFRHELVHIGREDSGNKFFLVFCTAMCWFNPLMWIAMRRCAGDLELSCDETVLQHADAETRHQYARLLLRTAGDDRGFTTCLSATAESMRYRLKRVTGASKRRVGSVLAGAIMSILFFSYGAVTIAYDPVSVDELLFSSEGSYQLQQIETDIMDGETIDLELAEAPLREYLSQWKVYRLGTEYIDGERSMTLRYSDPNGAVILRDHKMEIILMGKGNTVETYYFSEPVDWSYLQQLLSAYQ